MKTFEFDWKNFTLAQLEEKLKGTDVYLDHDIHPVYNSFWKKNLNTPLTISDYGAGEIYKGSENIYLDLSVFMLPDSNEELKIKIYTKDDHETLKAIAKSFVEKMKTGGSTEEMDEVPEGTSFSEEWQEVIRPYFESRGLQIHWLSEDDNYINYNVTDSKTGKTTQATEVLKKKLWNYPAKDVAEEMYNWVQDKYISYFKQGGSTEFWSKEKKKHAFFPTGEGYVYFYRGNPVAVVYNIKNEIEDFWGVWVPEAKITEVNKLLDQMLNETNSQKGYFISADDMESAVQEMKDNYNDSFAEGGSTKKYDVYDKIIILSVYDSRIDGLEGAIDYYENNIHRTSDYAVNKHSKLESLYRKKEEAEEAKKHFSKHNEIIDLEDSVDAKLFYNELNDLPKTNRGRSLFQSGESGKELYDRLLDLFDRVEAEVQQKYPELELYSKGGIVISKISDIPNLQDHLSKGKVTYRGLGMGKKANDYQKVAGEPVTLIKVDGKEYAIPDTEYRQLNWDEEKGEWKGLIKFSAPHRKFAEGGITENEFNERLDRAKREIVEDMLLGELPVSIKTFRELHFYVDANAYGGFFEPGYEMSEGFEFENSIQEALDQWIRKGGHVQMFLAQEALENKYSEGGLTPSRREELREKLEKLKDTWHDFALMGDSEYMIQDMRTMHSYLSDEPMKSLENQADDEGLEWDTYNKAFDEIFSAFTNASDEQVQALIDNHESYIDEAIADQDEYAHGGKVVVSPTSGTKAGYTYSLPDSDYVLNKDVTGIEVGDYVNITLPKGTIIKRLPGGTFANHPDIHSKFRNKRDVMFSEKFGLQIQETEDNLSKIIEASKKYEQGGHVPSYSEIKPEYAKGGYVSVPMDVKITGIYEFKTKDQVRTLMVNGFERQNDDSDSLYLDDEDKNKPEIGSVIVKNSAMRKMAKGNPVTAITSRSNEKGTLTRIKDRW
jgi:hypothetical protein